MSVWRFCLRWGVSWETFWSLSAAEESALMKATRDIVAEQRRNRRKG